MNFPQLICLIINTRGKYSSIPCKLGYASTKHSPSLIFSTNLQIFNNLEVPISNYLAQPTSQCRWYVHKIVMGIATGNWVGFSRALLE